MGEVKKYQVLIIDDERVGQAYLEEIVEAALPQGVLKKSVDTSKAMDLFQSHSFRYVFCNVPDAAFVTSEFFVNLRSVIAQKPHCFLAAIVDTDVMQAVGKQLKYKVDEIITKPVNTNALKMYFENKNRNSPSGEHFQSDYSLQLNPQQIIKLYKNNGEKIAGILKMYAETLPIQIEKLAGAFNSGSRDQLKSAAHSLKNSFSYLGNRDLYMVALDIEEGTDDNPEMAKFKQQVDSVVRAKDDLQDALLHLIEHYENN